MLIAVILVLATLATACQDASGASVPTMPGIGLEDNGPSDAETAPDFSVPTHDGSQFSLAQHIADDGRPVYLNLWASWCFPCREEMPAIDAAAGRHPGVKFVGVAVQDSTDAAAEFADEIQVSYTLGFDEQNQVDDGYRPLGLPASYIISGEGLILERIFGMVDGDVIDQKLSTWFGG